MIANPKSPQFTSSFGWLDYSEHERRKALDVIDLFREHDTRDELGIGVVRDAFAELFFPGTNTIQTRARYFLFVPWLYLNLERRRIPSDRVAAQARLEELALIAPLARSQDPIGTIGINAGRRLQRLPSNIYWLGLERWGIRTFHGSQDEYCRSLDAFYFRQKGGIHGDDGELIGGRVTGNWQGAIPKPPRDFPSEVSFQLTVEEATFLRERIITNAPRTLLAFLVDRGQLADGVPFPWEHPQFGEFPAQIQEALEHARNFSEAIHGAALLYNLMLSELLERNERIDEYQERLSGWIETIHARSEALAHWDRHRFWSIVESTGARITVPMRQFINEWLDLVLMQADGNGIIHDKVARDLIRERERVLKRSQARLANRRALELWNGAAGTAQLNYRWGTTQVLVWDILSAIGGGETNA